MNVWDWLFLAGLAFPLVVGVIVLIVAAVDEL